MIEKTTNDTQQIINNETKIEPVKVETVIKKEKNPDIKQRIQFDADGSQFTTKAHHTEPERIFKTSGKTKINLLVDQKQFKSLKQEKYDFGLSLDTLKSSNKTVPFNKKGKKISPGQKVGL